MIFRTGKYKGKSVDYVRRIAPWYIEWVRENRPEMLKRQAPTSSPSKNSKELVEPPEEDGKYRIQPNLDIASEWAPVKTEDHE